MYFDYIHGKQAEIYSFYMIPKVLFTEAAFSSLSTDAKVLYGLFLDRVSLSIKNNWIDRQGHAYVYYTIKGIKEALRCANSKACSLLTELQTFGLIERKRQGLGKPTIIYVKDFNSFRKSEFMNSENRNTEVPQSGIQEFRKPECNNTDNNNTEYNNTNPILSEGVLNNPEKGIKDKDKDEEERADYKEYLQEALETELLYEKFPGQRETIDAIVDLMTDVICSKRKTIRIAGDDKPANVVKSQFLKVNCFHIEYVLKCLSENGSKVRNIKQYMLASIYNAPLTMKSYYQAWVNNDIAEGRL